jgi:hypothetical protein
MDEIARSQDDFGSTFEASFARLQIRLEDACRGSADWPSGMAAAIRAGFEFAASHPTATSALTVDALAAGPDGIARHRRLLAYVAERLAAGRDLRPEGAELPQLTEMAVAGGLLGLVAERLTRGGTAELPALAPQAVQFALTPYIGVEEAKRIAVGPGSASRGADG